MAGHVLTNRVANPLLRRVLRGPLGRRAGRRLAVLRYPGRRTGRPHELVCQYVRDGGTVWILVGQAAGKTWWRNLRAPADVVLWLAGERRTARAVAVVGAERPEEATAGLTAYLTGMPAARRAVGLRAGGDVADVVAEVTLVRAELVP